RCARIFSLLVKNADSMSRDSREAANRNGRFTAQGDDPKRKRANSNGSGRGEGLRKAGRFNLLRHGCVLLYFRQSNLVGCFHVRTPETPLHISANVPQKNSPYVAQNSQGKRME